LAPHIRRAVTISDVIDLKSLEAQALSATLDKFNAGVAVVAETTAFSMPTVRLATCLPPAARSAR
jgi:hypothetical protein